MNVGGNTYAMPMPNWAAGRYYFCPNAPGTSTSSTLGNGTLRAIPFYVPNPIGITKIGGEITSASAGTLLRLGIYADGGTGRPGNLIVDAGTIDGNSATVQEITLSTPAVIGPGWYWAAGVVQNAAGTQPTVRIANSAIVQISGHSTAPGAGGVVIGLLHASTVSAALPSAMSYGGAAGSVPRIFVKT